MRRIATAEAVRVQPEVHSEMAALRDVVDGTRRDVYALAGFDRLCPLCGSPLVVRVARRTGAEFLGCLRWPGCQYTLSLPKAPTMGAMGG